jgi:hypothetical protein
MGMTGRRAARQWTKRAEVVRIGAGRSPCPGRGSPSIGCAFDTNAENRPGPSIAEDEPEHVADGACRSDLPA